MYPHRTRFKKQIVTEFLPPAQPSNKVLIFCDGMPGLPGNAKVMHFFRKKGFWTFYPRYRGTWESDGQFLKHCPSKDILDVIDELDNGKEFESFADGEQFSIADPEIYVIGISFGGPAALLASLDDRVQKVITIAGVVDWTVDKHMDWLRQFVAQGFGNGYRFEDSDWDKLSTGELYQPTVHVDAFDGKKILMIHATDDDVVPYAPTKQFAEQIGAELMTFKRGGHLSTGMIRRLSYFTYRTVRKYLKQ